jgi:hypothetical protein
MAYKKKTVEIEEVFCDFTSKELKSNDDGFIFTGIIWSLNKKTVLEPNSNSEAGAICWETFFQKMGYNPEKAMLETLKEKDEEIKMIEIMK